MLQSQQITESQELQAKHKPKSTGWKSLFNVLDKLKIKKTVTRPFIFHPPKPSYTFEVLVPEPNLKWGFKLLNDHRPRVKASIKIKAYKLYREKKKRVYMTPVIWLQNQKYHEFLIRWGTSTYWLYSRTSNYVILYSHGNSSDLGTAYHSAASLVNIFNMSAVLYDYTGYGISPHKASEHNLYDDIESVISFMVHYMNYSLDKIILCGFSLGSGPTVEMASRYKSIPFIMLFSPLASCLAVMEGKNISEKPSKHDIFANLGKMSELACDVIFVHGVKDKTIPVRHSVNMFNKYTETHSNSDNKAWLLEVEDGAHNQLITELESPFCEYTTPFMYYFNCLWEKAKEKRKLRKHKEKERDKENEEKEDKRTEEEKTNSNEQENEESIEGKVLKEETARLRDIFGKIVVNVEIVRKKAKQDKKDVTPPSSLEDV